MKTITIEENTATPPAVAKVSNLITPPGHEAGNTGENMNGKPVLFHDGNILTKGSAFVHKRLVTEPGWTLNLGDRCVFGCSYCYENFDVWAHTRMKKVPGLDGRDHCGVVVRRADAVNKLKSQLLTIPDAQRFPGTTEKTVAFTATHVDPAPNMTLARESAEALTVIIENTDWDVRVLSKSPLIREMAKLVPEKFKRRMILGLSTGNARPERRSARQGPASQEIEYHHHGVGKGLHSGACRKSERVEHPPAR